MDYIFAGIGRTMSVERCASLQACVISLRKQLVNTTAHLEDVARSVEDRGDPITSCNIRSAITYMDAVLYALPPDDQAPPKRLLDCIPRNTVFATTELLENILLFSHNADILRASQVSKAFQTTIESSVQLQRKLGFLADTTCSVNFPADGVGINLSSGTADELIGPISPFMPILRLSRELSFKFKADDDFMAHHYGKGNLPIARASVQIRKMLICQPPLTRVEVRTTCCGRAGMRTSMFSNPGTVAEVINIPTGVTVADLIDAQARVNRVHSRCPVADVYEHDTNGFVKVAMSFEATMMAPETEPLLMKRKKQEISQQREMAEAKKNEKRLRRYMLAKRAAHHAGEPIPSLVEYEAQQRMASESKAGANNGD